MTTIILLIMIGLLAGIVGGMSGVGGGIIIIPGLVILLGLTQQEAQGTSLALMIPPIGILAAYNYYIKGYVNIRYAIIIGLAFIIGGYFGSKISVNLPEVVVKRIFAFLLLIVSIKMFLGK